MSKENSAGLGVNNRYGPFLIPDGVVGVIKTEGAVNELTLEFSGKNINDDVILGTLPAGAKPLEAYVEIEEVFALGGTTPIIEVGTDGSEVTNGVSIAEATAEATGTTVITTFAGTWANALTANTNVSVALSGTSPTVTDAGKARVVVRYVKV